MNRYEIFTIDSIKWQYMYLLPNEWTVFKVKKWNEYLDYEIIELLDWNILKLIDTPKRKFKFKIYVIANNII